MSRTTLIAVRSLPVSLALVLTIACGNAPSSPPAQQPAQQTAAPSAVNPMEGAVRAPGSERLTPDPHPEQAHLTQVSTDSLADAITAYVAAEAKQRDGVFPVPAPDGSGTLALTLSTVHRERLSRMADGRYFACADFKAPNGTTYDVDMFMRAESTGLVPTEILVHKVNGAARFDWVERDGTWSAVPVSK